MNHRIKNTAWNKMQMYLFVTLISCSLLFTGCFGGKPALEKAATDAASYVYKHTPDPQVASVGGEWAVIGLKAGGHKTDADYEETYFDHVRALVKSKKGVLSEDRYTEYARVSLALQRIGKDPTNVEGYNLVTPLDDKKKIADQGINAAIFALITSNVTGVKLKQEKTYLGMIIKGLDEEGMYDSDQMTDYLSMAIEGLSFYQDQKEAKETIDRCLETLSKYQKDDGSFGNCESTAECIIALSQLGKDVSSDSKFIKNGKNLYDGLLEYRLKDGSFCHVLEQKNTDAMATEKALLAMDAMLLRKEGKAFYQGAGK